MSSLISWYASLICPLSPFSRSLIIAVVVLLAIGHMRIMTVAARWLRNPELGLSRRSAVTFLIAAHFDAALVAAFAIFHGAAEAQCGYASGLVLLRTALPLGAAASMALYAWAAFLPVLRHSSPSS